MSASDDLQRFYRERVLEHSRAPHNFGKPSHADKKAHGHNPLCGDQVTVYIDMQDGKLNSIQFDGSGCAISVASASMMTDALQGLSSDEAVQLMADVERMFAGSDAVNDRLDEVNALKGVRAYPSRIKCATLPWQTAAAALRGQQSEVSTENS